jgi:hypothetical protein
MNEAPPACLAVVDVAVRGVLEEQFANILWLSLVLRGMRVPLDVLLCREAARFALRNPAGRPCLQIGGITVAASDFCGDVARLLDAGARVFVVAEDLAQKDRAAQRFVDGVERIDRDRASLLIAQSRRVWFW